MAKPPMPRITEPDEGLVHYVSEGMTGNVTLCGLTDFIGHKEQGKPTRQPVTCCVCISIKAHCDQHSK